jgi:GTP-binding protein
MKTSLPSIVIVGRPNVGKSTLFNRITESRRSIVTDEPGITRDRIHGVGHWNGRPFELVDTGGIVPDDKALIPREIFRQARVAIDAAAILVLVVDARDGIQPLDAELARMLHSTGKPFVISANKVDGPQHVSLAAPFFELTDRVFPVSSEHGFGIDDLLDELTKGFAEGPETRTTESALSAVNVAIIGRPNVGKSTLLNKLVGSERSIVSAEPGTTRDAVDTTVEREGRAYRFIDTAGIRRKAKTKLLAEKLSVVMARKHLEQSDVALMMLDGEMGVTSQDGAIAHDAWASGRSVILVLNKWDLAIAAAEKQAKKRVEPGRLRQDYEKLIRNKLKFLAYAPLVFLSAMSGQQVVRLYSLIDQVNAARRRRVTTGELNRWLREADIGRGSSPTARMVKIFYITQASTQPPTFILFTNQKKPLHFSFERFLENRLRESFDFTGSPIRFLQRQKQK